MRLTQPFLKLPRRYCADTLAAEVLALPRDAWLPHPGRLAGNDAVPLVTPGGAITNGFTGPMEGTEHLRSCPYIMEIMADLGAVWGRSRLMGLAPGSIVPAHVDVGYYWRTHLRIHIPVITNPRVSFTCGGETVHMGAGECWVFDSFQMHNVQNAGTEKRVHLVLDTVGGEQFGDLVSAAAEGANDEILVMPTMAAGLPTRDLAYEYLNAPEIMSSWEVRCHVEFLLGHIPKGSEDAIAKRLDRFMNGWTAAWSQFGTANAGLASYRSLISQVRNDLKMMRADTIVLPNQVRLDRALDELIFQVATPPSVAHQ